MIKTECPGCGAMEFAPIRSSAHGDRRLVEYQCRQCNEYGTRIVPEPKAVLSQPELRQPDPNDVAFDDWWTDVGHDLFMAAARKTFFAGAFHGIDRLADAIHDANNTIKPQAE